MTTPFTMRRPAFTSRLLLVLTLLLTSLTGWAQSLTQSLNFVAASPSSTPLFAANGSTTANRLPFLYRATLTGLTAGKVYRYTLGAGALDANNGVAAEGSTSNGAGNPVFVVTGATTATSTYTYSTNQNLAGATAGTNYGLFTADGSGRYTGWFGIVPTGNARFAAGTVLYPIISLSRDDAAVAGTLEARYFLNESFTVLTYGTTADAKQGTYVQGASLATAKNLVSLYDNETGTGRPLSTTLVEPSGAAVSGGSAIYKTTSGSYNTIIPNMNPSGVRRAVQLSVVDASVVGCQSSATAFAGTANPTGGATTPVAITNATAPLNTNGCTALAVNPNLTISNGTFTPTEVSTPTTSTNFTIANSSATAQPVALSVTGPFTINSAPTSIPAGGSATFTITFNAPATAGTRVGTLRVVSGGFQDVSSNFAATATAPATPNTALTITNGTFPPTVVGTPSSSTGFKLNNSGATAQTVTLSASGAPFSLATTSYTVPAGGFKDVVITFTPTAAGTFTGRLTAAVSGFANVVSAPDYSATATAPATTITATSANGSVLLAGVRSTILVQGVSFLNGPGLTNTVTYSNGTVNSVSNVGSSTTILRVDITPTGAGNLQVKNTNGDSNLFPLTTSTPPTTDLFEPFELYATSGAVNTSSYNTVAPASTDFTLNSGTVTLSGTLLSNTDLSTIANEKRNNSQSARMRAGGYIEFARPAGVSTLKLLAGFYGADNVGDPNATFTVTYSVNGGAFSAPVAGAPAAGALPTTLTAYTFAINQSGNVRVRISNTIPYSGSNVARINVDDVQLNNYFGDLVVDNTNSSQAVPKVISGAYNNITVASNGFLVFGGPVSASGAVIVNGVLSTNCQPLTGAASFTLNDNGSLAICDAAGITQNPSALGAIRVTGERTFSPGASYGYNGTAAQSTGNGLPTTVRNLAYSNPAGLTLTQAVTVTEVARAAAGSGTLTSNGLLTLRSSQDGTVGTALLADDASTANAGGSVVGAVNVQRAITRTGDGYRHVSAPISTATVNSLTTNEFTPIVNPLYNTSAQPRAEPIFPTVYFYDQSRVANNVPGLFSSPFEKGFKSPNAQGDGLTVGLGYAVQTPQTTFTFSGTVNNGNYTLPLAGAGSNAPGAQTGFNLVGNPYPSPLDLSGVTISGAADNSIYVFVTATKYSGNYGTYLRQGASGGLSTLPGSSSVVALGQGFLMHVTPPAGGATVTGAVALTNANRVNTFTAAQGVFNRGTSDSQPTLKLALSNAADTRADRAIVYFSNQATAGVDSKYDALKLPNPGDAVNLSSLAAGQNLAINGLPVVTKPVVVALNATVSQTGSFYFQAEELTSFAAGTTVVLRDALTGTSTVLRAGGRYAFSTSTTSLTGRFTLEFSAAGALATAAQSLLAQVQLYPNPAHGSFTLTVPVLKTSAAVTATLSNSLGQVVRRQVVAGGKLNTIQVGELAAGIYQLRLVLDGTQVVRRVVVE